MEMSTDIFIFFTQTYMVVGRDAAQTPSRFNVFSSSPSATIKGGAQVKHAVTPGISH